MQFWPMHHILCEDGVVQLLAFYPVLSREVNFFSIPFVGADFVQRQ